jgi:2-hydroxychromene-2-carboxylate isomerase
VSAVAIRHFTDPGCPLAFSAEPQRLRLLWRYGDQIAWEPRMVVLVEHKGEWRSSEDLRRLQVRYGMPIDWRERLWNAATIHACRAVVATRLRWPDREAALLRRLRVLAMAGELLDDSDTLELAAAQAGLPVQELAAFCAEPEVEQALRADMAAARPSPSFELRRIAEPAPRVDLPGLQPIEAYEAALADLAPELERRPDPDSATEVLAWAGMPLATVEVAAVCARDVAGVRAELERSARFEPVGGDGYWTTVARPLRYGST